MSFEAKNYQINDILNRSAFSIPRNQRKYVWKKDNWQDLFDDILFSIEEENAHFIGSIVLEGSTRKIDGISQFTVIDGQQRLTTITLLLIAIMKHFQELGMDNEFKGTIPYLCAKDDNNRDVILLDSSYHISLGKLVNSTILLDKRNVPIISFINENILTSKDKAIGEAVAFFYESIKEDLQVSDNPKLRLTRIRKAVLDMTAVRIIANSEEDSYTIFEILNARGQALEACELLKNFIMRYIQPTARRDEAKQKWEALEEALGSSLNRYISHYCFLHNVITKSCRANWRMLHLQNGESCSGYGDKYSGS